MMDAHNIQVLFFGVVTTVGFSLKAIIFWKDKYGVLSENFVLILFKS